MNRFQEKLLNADARITRAFAESQPAILYIDTGARQVNVIFEAPDSPVSVPERGEIQDHAPAFSAMTAEIAGLNKHDGVSVGGQPFYVTHIGTDEEGRTRVSLAYGSPGKKQPDITGWSAQ